jgi:hypothetical protein
LSYPSLTRANPANPITPDKENALTRLPEPSSDLTRLT